MPTILSHALAAGCIAHAALPASYHKVARKSMVAWCALISILPDLDIITFKLGIPYASPWGHRGFSHSILFALLLAGVTLYFSRRLWPSLGISARAALALFSMSALSHTALDMLTDASFGTALWMPFNRDRVLFGWQPIEGAPFSPRAWLGTKGLRVLSTELLYIALPCILLLLGKKWCDWRFPPRMWR